MWYSHAILLLWRSWYLLPTPKEAIAADGIRQQDGAQNIAISWKVLCGDDGFEGTRMGCYAYIFDTA